MKLFLDVSTTCVLQTVPSIFPQLLATNDVYKQYLHVQLNIKKMFVILYVVGRYKNKNNNWLCTHICMNLCTAS